MIDIFQLIPEDEKTEQWAKKVSMAIKNEAESKFAGEHTALAQLWDVYNNEFDAKDYEYLTKVEGELSYPAKVRDIASKVIRSKLNILESKQARRRFKFKCMVCDERSMSEKYAKRVDNILDSIESSLDDSYDYVKENIASIQDRLQDLEKQLQVQPQDEQAQAQMEQLKANMPMIRLEYNKILRALNRQSLDMDQVKSKIGYFKQFNDVEIAEILASSFIKSALAGNLRDAYDSGFREKIATDHPTFFIDYDRKSGKVVFKRLDSVSAYYDRDGDNEWSQDGEWCGYKEYMNITQVMAEFDLAENERQQVTAYMGNAPHVMMSTQDGAAVFNDADNRERVNNGIPVFRVWWLSPREWFWVKTPNRHQEGQFFHHVVTDMSKFKKRATDTVERNIVYDRYSAVIIGNQIVKPMGVDRNVYRTKDRPGYVALPIVTKTFNKLSTRPYSMIKRVESLRELYNIIWYNIELSIVLSGVRGMVMDKSQKPDGMSTRQWMYYRKMGTMWIESMKKGRKVAPTFNQFQTFDDSLSQSLQISYQLLMQVENLIGRVLGITDPMLGQQVSEDAVHNVMMSTEQSSLITEILYYDYDTVFSKALGLYTNLCCQYELGQDKVVNYVDEDLQDVMFRIPGGVLNMSDFKVGVHNNVGEDNKIDQLRQAALTQIPIDGMAALFNVESMVEMEKKLHAIVVEQENRKSQSQMAIDNNKSQGDQQTAKLKGELDNARLQLEAQIKQAELELKRASMEIDSNYKQWEMGFKEKELEQRNNVDLLGIASENEVESAYLGETTRSNMVAENLEASRMRIESMLGTLNAMIAKQHGDKKVDADIRKAELQATRRKNNIKD
mgnify:CR=1 FL=1